jgi:hypothetical protein
MLIVEKVMEKWRMTGGWLKKNIVLPTFILLICM